jgi:Ca2+-binding RTX toxin-like protein
MLLSTVKIPVFNYHREEVLEADATNGFNAQMNLLSTMGFDTITLDQYLTFRNSGSLPSGVDKPFIAVFDDATDDVLSTAAPFMKNLGRVVNGSPVGFTGVAAVPTGFVGLEDESGKYMTWGEIRTLVKNYGWEVASHSINHLRMGNGVPTEDGSPRPLQSTGAFANTPEALVRELRDSKQAIIDNVFDDLDGDGVKDSNEPSKTPIAFFHPYHDLSRRSLATAAEYYPLVFGFAWGLVQDPSENKFIGLTSGLTNGELVRVGIDVNTTIDDDPTIAGDSGFRKLLQDAASNATFALPNVHPHIPYYYLDSSGTVVVDGTSSGDTITLDGSQSNELNYNGSGIDLSTLPTTALYANPPAISGFYLNGGGGNDRLGILQTMSGMTNPSTLVGAAGNDAVDGGGGNEYLDGGSGTDTIFGMLGNDTVQGGDGTDYLEGSGGNDVILGSAGNDTAAGGSGEDTVDFSGATSGSAWLRANLSTPAGDEQVFFGSGSTYTWSMDPENVIGTGGDDTLTGSSGDNDLIGSGGDDTIFGAAGNDSLVGGFGNDTLDGGDNYSDTIDGGPGDDLIDDEELVPGLASFAIDSSGTLVVQGQWGMDLITIERTGADDVIVRVNEENRTYDMDDFTSVVLKGNNGYDDIRVIHSVARPLRLEGGSGNDTLVGHDGGDTLIGADGNDSLRGNSGNDSLDGAAGNDSLYGDAGTDTVLAGDGNDVVRGGSGNDHIEGQAGNDALFGETGGDQLYGGIGFDAIEAGDGNDTIDASDGAMGDFLHGGIGSDTAERELRDYFISIETNQVI